ncbi:MAG: hypothetical protein IPP57_23560 [Candidatus Obscuribacter sp.]|jgi:hypothetical protein|nr:hypothetical protein [Candidatus Obscuribacter sp.]MDQ5966627.1 hypothetical protein [Cyanobacteriota bacterium erpe_2018_sw_39hr_WHONDRS-SW48-000098_B_bin.30]MBK9617573.1 hypothetical protein [Candidatus Obscuribacter sp.]MBK9773755.1 hypothetical protein [Candidatus Obscuribacter sp.]MBL0189104.1 hypothetical protein [Candidatus Obscuribacter sp.]
MSKQSNGNEFELYLAAGRKLTAQGDYKQAEKILGYGLKMLEKRMQEENLLLQSFIGCLVELDDKRHYEPQKTGDQKPEVQPHAAAMGNQATEMRQCDSK